MKKMIHMMFCACLVLSFASLAGAQTVYDFDDGTTQGFTSITRPDTYNDEPTVVSSDADLPAAFPAPSTPNVLRVADDDEDSFGLCSAVGGTTFDRTATSFVSAVLEAEIYIVASASGTEGNMALIAINDGTPSLNEAYYRFGYRNDEVYLQKFDGAGFSTLGTDTDLDGTNMTIPGWNTFTLTFTGPDQIACEVNGAAASFSPVTDTDAGIDTEMQVGVLGFNFSSFNPILADNISEEITINTSKVDGWTQY